MSQILKFDRTPVARLVSCAATFGSAALLFDYMSHGAKEIEALPFAGLFLLFLLPAVVVLLAAVLLVTQRVRRHRVFRTQPVEKAAPAPQPRAAGMVGQWSAQFTALEAGGRWGDLADLLANIAKTHPAEYANWNLGYLRARALVEN